MTQISQTERRQRKLRRAAVLEAVAGEVDRKRRDAQASRTADEEATARVKLRRAIKRASAYLDKGD